MRVVQIIRNVEQDVRFDPGLVEPWLLYHRASRAGHLVLAPVVQENGGHAWNKGVNHFPQNTKKHMT